MDNLTLDLQGQSKELASIRSRGNLSQQNWSKERDDLIEREAYSREQYQNAEQAMREWEVLALEERSIRKDLTERAGDLEDQVSGLKEGLAKATAERDTNSNTVDGLQRALQEIQTARKRELRDLAETSQAEADQLRTQLAQAQSSSASAVRDLATVRAELERALPFEKEVREKNLLIGKLRHEAVTLNEHLTKALRFLKKGKPEDNVDR
jgi:chromosome segregation ATPase